MESSESHEPSYYEVALTNRQVLIAFVVLLTSIVTAFLSGVWIGRGGSSSASHAPAINAAAATTTEPPLEQLTFFNGKEAGTRTAGAGGALRRRHRRPLSGRARRDVAARERRRQPRGRGAAAEEKATEAMRQNLDATMAANRTVPSPSTAASPTSAPPASAPPAGSAPAKPAPVATKAPAPAKPAVAGKTFVQVYSSTNAARAQEIVAQLRKAGFAVVVAETPKGGGTNSRVRVGPYADRAKADAAANRLRREFRLETWVTDSP